MNNKAEVIFRNPDTDQKVIIDFVNNEELSKLEFKFRFEPPLTDEKQEIGLIGALAEILLTELNRTDE